MELDWTTTILEVINFLVLVWLLKRFLYQPVLKAVEQRRLGLEQSLQQARDQQQAADALKTSYEQRLQQWESEKQGLRAALEQRLSEERQQKLQKLQTDLQAEVEKQAVSSRQQANEQLARLSQQALQLAAAFAAKLLALGASPQLQQQLLQQILGDLQHLDDAPARALHQSLRDGQGQLQVRSAFALDDSQRSALQTALQHLAEQPLQIDYREDPSLLAGLQIQLADRSLGLNLRDELSGFAELSHGPA